MPVFGDADQEEWVLPENSMVHRQLSEKPMGRETTELFEAMVGKLTSLRMTGRVSGHVVASRSRGGSEDFAHPLSSYDSTEGSESLTATNSSHQGASGTISTQSSFFRSRKSTDLLMDLSSDLLRGVPMHVLLRRFGVEWKQVSGPDALKWRPRLSRETRKYSFFFSHDWLTTRFAKYFALLIFFNGRAAAIATFLSSCTLGLLLAFQILQQGDDVRWYWIFANHVVGLFFLLFWQHIREALTCTERLGFLDRMCIPQHDQEKKIQCIYGLASFLNRSEQLIVLWSPRYFTRLWCVYEIACFLMKRKAADRIHFLPVQMPVVWLMAYCVFTQIFTVATYGQRDTNHTFDWYDQTGEGKINLVLLMIYMCTLFLPFYYFLNKMTSMMFELPEQLRNFHIDKANCFCCSNNHIHPATGEDMECDRELIYGVLQFWCGRSKVSQAILRDDENSRVHVEDIHQVFKKHLDKQLLPTIEETFTHTGFLMRPLMSAVVMAASPYLTDFFSEEGRRIFLRLRENRVRNFGLWVHIFMVAIITLRLYLMIGQLGGRYWKGKWWWKMAMLITQVGLHMLIMVPMMMSYVIAISVAGRGFFTSAISMLPLFLLAIEIPLTVWFTRHLCGCRRSKLIGGSPKERRTKKTEFAQEPLWEERVEEHKEAEEQIPDEKQAFETKVEIDDAEKSESQDQEKSLSVRENVSTNASTMSPDQENVTFEGEEFNMDLSSDEESEPPPPVASAASMRSIFAI